MSTAYHMSSIQLRVQRYNKLFIHQTPWANSSPLPI